MITKGTFEKFLNDTSLNMSRETLETTMEEELNKSEDDMDTELIDLCVQSLLEIEDQTSDQVIALNNEQSEPTAIPYTIAAGDTIEEKR